MMLNRYISCLPLALASALPGPSRESRGVCTISTYADIPKAVSECSSITLSSIRVPAGESLDLSMLKDGSKVTFEGSTTFDYADKDYDMIKIGGSNITITAETGAVLDGNGKAWWDGNGSNSGTTKPNRFLVASKVTGNSVIENLHIQNWPVHCFSIDNCDGLRLRNLVLDNSAGNSPNSKSNGKPAAHNTDGFDISASNNIILSNNHVENQDDCVAVTSGTNITAIDMTCVGGHGLSIGSVGGKSDNSVQNVRFENSSVINSANGVRIKTNSGTTGTVQQITYRNITLSNISDYGLDIQQDYLNGGATGKPTNGVKISGVTMTGVTGTVNGGRDYYILCGANSCDGFNFNDVKITGGSNDSCNYHPQGDFRC